MKIAPLTNMLIIINQIIDSGKSSFVSFDEVEQAINNKRLFPLLIVRYGEEHDFSLLNASSGPFGDFISYFEDTVHNITSEYSGGVKHNGLCLIAYALIEAIQQGDGLTW